MNAGPGEKQRLVDTFLRRDAAHDRDEAGKGGDRLQDRFGQGGVVDAADRDA